MRNPPQDEGNSSIGVETMSIYVGQIDMISDELCSPGFLKSIITSVLTGFPAPIGNPDELRREGQMYAAARDGAVAARSTLLVAETKLLDAWVGATGDAIQMQINESLHKIGTLIDNYQVGYSVLLSYASAVRAAQQSYVDGRALVSEALNALAPLPDHGSLQNPEVRAVLPEAREQAKNGCHAMLSAVDSLDFARMDARYRLDSQMQASRAVLGGSVPSMIDLPDAEGSPSGALTRTTDVEFASDGGVRTTAELPIPEDQYAEHSTTISDSGSLPVAVPAARFSTDSVVARNVRGALVSGSRRDPDDKSATADTSTADQAVAVSTASITAPPPPASSPSPGTPQTIGGIATTGSA